MVGDDNGGESEEDPCVQHRYIKYDILLSPRRLRLRRTKALYLRSVFREDSVPNKLMVIPVNNNNNNSNNNGDNNNIVANSNSVIYFAAQVSARKRQYCVISRPPYYYAFIRSTQQPKITSIDDKLIVRARMSRRVLNFFTIFVVAE